MHHAGIVNTVALMGTAISEPHITALKRLATTVVVMLDGDDAEAKAGGATRHDILVAYFHIVRDRVPVRRAATAGGCDV